MTATGGPRPFVSRAPKLGLVPGFDGFRGTGMLLVMLVHASGPLLESWATFVDAFFVLSGFLITTLLLQESRSTGTISLRQFYARRATRLFPSLWLFCAVWLVIAAVATAVGFEPLHLRHVGADVAAAALYVYHLFFPLGLATIEPAIQNQRSMWHLWTLGVEEWFYLVIPAVVIVCVRRNWVKQLAAVMLAGFVAIGLARWFAYTGFFQDRSGVLPGIRMFFMQRPDGLMLGVALAVFNAHLTPEFVERHRRRVLALAAVATVVWLVTMNLSLGIFERFGLPYFEYLPPTPEEFNRPHMLETLYWFRFGHTVCTAAFAVMTFALVHYWDWWLSRFWSIGALQHVGRLSYTLYIWHGLPFIILLGLTDGMDAPIGVQLLRVPLLYLATFAIAIPVYRYVEMPALRLKMRFYSEPEVLDRRTGEIVRNESSTGGTGPAVAPRSGADGTIVAGDGGAVSP